jgi:hypothetical protein
MGKMLTLSFMASSVFLLCAGKIDLASAEDKISSVPFFRLKTYAEIQAMSVDSLGGKNLSNLLRRARLDCVGQVLELSGPQLRKRTNISASQVDQIRGVLAGHGVALFGEALRRFDVIEADAGLILAEAGIRTEWDLLDFDPDLTERVRLTQGKITNEEIYDFAAKFGHKISKAEAASLVYAMMQLMAEKEALFDKCRSLLAQHDGKVANRTVGDQFKAV